MSLLPSPGSVVRLKDGRVAVVIQITPGGEDDRMVVVGGEVPMDPDQIEEIIYEVE